MAPTNEIEAPELIVVLPAIELDNVIVVPEISVTVVSEGIPVPVTKSPTAISEASDTSIV